MISIVAGLMTIFGVGGLLSWSLLKKTKESLPDATLSVVTLSFKLGLCVLLLLLFSLPMHFMHVFIVLAIGKGHLSAGKDMYWGSEDWVAYVISYVINVLIWFPAYFIACSCVFSWSIQPVKIFYKRLAS